MIIILGWFGLGAALGWLSILNQHWTVSQIAPGRRAFLAIWVGLGVVLRWTAAAVLLFFAFQSGFLNGLAAISGLILARWFGLIYFTRRI